MREKKKRVVKRKPLNGELRFLAESSRILDETFEYRERLQKIADLVVPDLADWCIVHTIENGALEVQAVANRDRSKVHLLLEAAKRYPPHKNSLYGDSFSVEYGTPRLVKITSRMLRKAAVDRAHLKAMQALNTKSLISVPLVARRKTLGSLTLAMSDSGRAYSRKDYAFAQIVANRFAMAADNARLYREAQEAIRAREDIVAIVSHDLKNPLAAIQLGAELLQKRRPEAIPQATWEQINDRIEAILRSTKVAFALIHDLLDLSSVESGHLQIQKKAKVDAVQLAKSVVTLMGPLAEQKSVKLELKFEGERFLTACDEDRISQVLSNLVGNALKFTSSGGSIVVRLSANESELHFSVEDTGTGIAKEDLPHIFDRYWQAKKDHMIGSGLGLFIAKGIIEGHGGKLWVVSEEGKGSTFHFVLPLNGGFEPRIRKVPAERSSAIGSVI